MQCFVCSLRRKTSGDVFLLAVYSFYNHETELVPETAQFVKFSLKKKWCDMSVFSDLTVVLLREKSSAQTIARRADDDPNHRDILFDTL